MKSDLIWMDGKFVPYDQATIHILSPSIHYGPAVFEGARCYHSDHGPATFRLREHMNRFVNSCKILGFELEYSVAELCDAVHETILANRFKECYIRPLMSLEGPLSLNLANSKPHISISTWEWGTFLGEDALEKGANLMVSSFTRMHPNASMTKAKIGGQYVNSMLAKSLAVKMGFDEAILLDPEGYVAECSGENLFLVEGDRITTPPRAAILEGITRDLVIVLANDLGYEVVEGTISRDQLYIVDEVFVSGTAAEVTPVSQIDFRPIGLGRRAPPTPATVRSNAMIGPSIKIKGEVTGDEDLVIQGKVDGTDHLNAHALSVGESGKVSADIHAKTIKIDGEVTGDITAH